ncbi:MAG TPA: HDOD domain-containing protein [Desulfobacterales bacterium]|nr:HDOD domain-containing protein [Desulfobacterales bacterium]HIP40564.1 HDOD domain-containing protein [Desulfocapsa sulfexigens]
MQEQQISNFFKQVDSLPSLPVTATKVLSVTADPESSAKDLVNAILPDQAMCATILKIANSAFFGIPRKVATMERAVTILGFNEIHNIVLGKAVFSSFQKMSKNYQQPMDHFWKHSFSCGLAAKIIAQQLKQPPGELFIAGLIHDIGQLVFFISKPDDYFPVMELKGTDHIKSRFLEMDTFGVDHAQVGFHLLERWLFPDQLLTAVGFHHQPQECTDHALYAIIVQISDALSLLANVDDQDQETPLLPQLTEMLPEGEQLWQEYDLAIDETQLQDWMEDLKISKDKDSGILDILTS